WTENPNGRRSGPVECPAGLRALHKPRVNAKRRFQKYGCSSASRAARRRECGTARARCRRSCPPVFAKRKCNGTRAASRGSSRYAQTGQGNSDGRKGCAWHQASLDFIDILARITTKCAVENSVAP